MMISSPYFLRPIDKVISHTLHIPLDNIHLFVQIN